MIPEEFMHVDVNKYAPPPVPSLYTHANPDAKKLITVYVYDVTFHFIFAMLPVCSLFRLYANISA